MANKLYEKATRNEAFFISLLTLQETAFVLTKFELENFEIIDKFIFHDTNRILNCRNFNSLSFNTKHIKKLNNNLYYLKINVRGSRFFKNSKSNALPVKEKVTKHGVKRLLSLAAPEKYKLMGN